MSFFRPYRAAGVVYRLDHLDPFVFQAKIDDRTIAVRIDFSCHCFTKGLEPHHKPADIYEHRGDRRAFCTERYELSKTLPTYFAKLMNSTVYLDKNNDGFFFWRTPGGNPIWFSSKHSAPKIRTGMC